MSDLTFKERSVLRMMLILGGCESKALTRKQTHIYRRLVRLGYASEHDVLWCITDAGRTFLAKETTNG